MSNVDNSAIEKILREIQAGQVELQKQVVLLAHGQIALRNDFNTAFKEFRSEMADLKKEVRSIHNSVDVLAIASNDHNIRLTRIEELFLSRPHN